MKKISAALLVALSTMTGIASAQTTDNGIVMTHDREVAAKIEQHARDIQAQPAVQQDTQAAAEKVEQTPAPHHHHKKSVAKSKKASASIACK